MNVNNSALDYVKYKELNLNEYVRRMQKEKLSRENVKVISTWEENNRGRPQNSGARDLNRNERRRAERIGLN